MLSCLGRDVDPLTGAGRRSSCTQTRAAGMRDVETVAEAAMVAEAAAAIERQRHFGCTW